MKDNTFKVKPYTAKQLASLYGVSLNTIKKWIKPFSKEIGEKIGHFYNTRQVIIIIDNLGPPESVYEF